MNEIDNFTLPQLNDTFSRSKVSLDIFAEENNFTLSQYLNIYEGRPLFDLGLQPFDMEQTTSSNLASYKTQSEGVLRKVSNCINPPSTRPPILAVSTSKSIFSKLAAESV